MKNYVSHLEDFLRPSIYGCDKILADLKDGNSLNVLTPNGFIPIIGKEKFDIFPFEMLATDYHLRFIVDSDGFRCNVYNKNFKLLETSRGTEMIYTMLTGYEQTYRLKIDPQKKLNKKSMKIKKWKQS